MSRIRRGQSEPSDSAVLAGPVRVSFRLHTLQNTSSPGAISAGLSVFVAVFTEHRRKQREAALGMRAIPARSEIEPIHISAEAAIFSRIPYLVKTLLQHISEAYVGYAFLSVVDVAYVRVIEIVAGPYIAVPANEGYPVLHKAALPLGFGYERRQFETNAVFLGSGAGLGEYGGYLVGTGAVSSHQVL